MTTCLSIELDLDEIIDLIWKIYPFFFIINVIETVLSASCFINKMQRLLGNETADDSCVNVAPEASFLSILYSV